MSDDEELHEVAACYDNMAALASGYRYGIPCFLCSCGFHCAAETWEDAGADYDEHLSESGVRP